MENNKLLKSGPEPPGDAGEDGPKNTNKGMAGKVMSYLFLALTVIYTLSPADIVPDVVPFVGWFDDLILLFSAFFNVIQKHVNTSNETLDAILRTMNKIFLILGIIAIVFLGIFVGVFVGIFVMLIKVFSQ